MKKRIIILSNETTHHSYFINRLIQNGVEIVAVVYETLIHQSKFVTGPFFDTEQEQFEKEHFFKEFTSDLPEDLPVHHVRTVNDAKAIDLIKKYDADLGIVFGCGKIQPPVFKTTRDGLINIHRGVAAKYRGLDSDLWAIYNRDLESLGVTIHKVEEDLDTGDVLKEACLVLDPIKEIYQLRYYTTVLAADLVLEVLKEYEQSGSLRMAPQKTKGKYFSAMPLELKNETADIFNQFFKVQS